MIADCAHPAMQPIQHVDRSGRTHDHASAEHRVGVDVHDRVVQSSDVGDDRNGAVAHRLHLGEPAWFETARHDEQITTGEQPMRQTFVVAAVERDGARRGVGGDPQLIGETLVAVAEDCQSGRHHRQ